MTKSEIFKAAHAEARTMKNVRNYREAFMFGLRRVHAKIARDAFVAATLAQPEAPKFMHLRGL